jgi:LysM repeat protein
VHTVQGDTVEAIAYRQGVTPDYIRHYNPNLVVDSSGRVAPQQQVAVVGVAGNAEMHSSRHGDSYASVAHAYGCDEVELRQYNPGCTFAAGEHIRIPPPAPHRQLSYAAPATQYEMAREESFSDVARRFSVREDDLRRANPGAAQSPPGSPQHLVIPRSNMADYDSLPASVPASPTHAHFESARVVQCDDRDTLQMLADRYGVQSHDLAALNPHIAQQSSLGGQTVVLPPRAQLQAQTFQSAEYPYDSAMSSPLFAGGAAPGYPAARESQQAQLRDVHHHHTERVPDIYGADEAARATRRADRNLAEFEGMIESLGGHRDAEVRELAIQLRMLMTQYETQRDEYARCVAANGEWAARCKALEYLAAGNPEKEEMLRLATELHTVKALQGANERRLRGDLEREFARRAREQERERREELVRQRAEHDVSMTRSTAPQGPSAGAAAAAAGAPAATNGPAVATTIEDIEPFLRYKDDEVARLVQQVRELESENAVVVARNTSLQDSMAATAYAIDSRPSLLKILFDLFAMGEECVRRVNDVTVRLSVRDLGKRVLTAELARIEEQARGLLKGHRWIIGNLFTDDEVRHLGASPLHFSDVASPAAIPSHGSNAGIRGRAGTPTRARGTVPSTPGRSTVRASSTPRR